MHLCMSASVAQEDGPVEISNGEKEEHNEAVEGPERKSRTSKTKAQRACSFHNIHAESGCAMFQASPCLHGVCLLWLGPDLKNLGRAVCGFSSVLANEMIECHRGLRPFQSTKRRNARLTDERSTEETKRRAVHVTASGCRGPRLGAFGPTKRGRCPIKTRKEIEKIIVPLSASTLKHGERPPCFMQTGERERPRP